MIAHRGLIRFENKVQFFPYVMKRQNIRGIECDVHRNTQGDIVVTHDFEDRDKLCSDRYVSMPRIKHCKMVIDIKTFKKEGVQMARDVVEETSYMAEEHDWFLCSFNKECVEELVKLKDDTYKVGYIHNGFLSWPIVEGIDFVSLHWRNITPKTIEHYHSLNIKVFAWTVPLDMVDYIHDMGVDEIISDIN